MRDLPIEKMPSGGVKRKTEHTDNKKTVSI